MESKQTELTRDQIYLRARLARDARFDGVFFTGVKTTGIYCRSICPAPPAKEKNVNYFNTAIEAANAGLRPCLRCRPDSAPQSPAWKGAKTTLERAIKLIEELLASGASVDLESVSVRLGISSRYLRQLFNKHLGTSPKQYTVYKKLLFAKQLLHETSISVTEVALNSGFESIRNFNHTFQTQLGLTPSQIRNKTIKPTEPSSALTLFLSYRPPYNWEKMKAFLSQRVVQEMEWFENEDTYYKTFSSKDNRGYFMAKHIPCRNGFEVSFYFSDESKISNLYYLTELVKRILDLDANVEHIEKIFSDVLPIEVNIHKGLRVSGTGNAFEAMNRAILGQQVSIIQAVILLGKLVHEYGEVETINNIKVRYFPTPKSLKNAHLEILKMPGARKQAIRNVAEHFSSKSMVNLDECLALKGIGPWTVDYAKMRGTGDPNIFLATDLVVKNKLKLLFEANGTSDVNIKTFFETMQQKSQPWCSYLTFQLWNLDNDK